MLSTLHPEHLKALEGIAHEAGFLECAAVPLTEDPNFETYQTWIEQEHHLPLNYLGNHLDKRKDPRRLGQELKTAIAFCHPTPQEFSSQFIARYAWGSDYHYTLREKIKQVSQQFQASFGELVEEKVCVDTIPILERSICERAGLGWIGKNGCLISRKHGSFFMLSVWLISASCETEIVPNPGTFHCGTCTRCLDACPTDAFISPGLLDAELCLASQTIELRGVMDAKFHPKLTHQAFGCDICQEVCPWNRKTLPKVDNEHLPPVLELLALDEPSFRSYFRKTALERPGWAGLRRNFLILASNHDPFPTSLMEDHLKHPHDIVSSTARQILDLHHHKIKS
jgi:epoxyqueuosine reductase